MAEVKSEAMAILDSGLFTFLQSRKKKERGGDASVSFAEGHGMLNQQRNKAGGHVGDCYLIKIRSDQIKARHGFHAGIDITRNSAYKLHFKDGRQRHSKSRQKPTQ